MSSLVSLPSIHEMFPEHLMRLPPNLRLGISSHPAIAPCPSPPKSPMPRSMNTGPSPTSSKRSATESVYSFDVLRSDPSSSSLQHIASSAAPPTSSLPSTQARVEDISKGSAPAFRVNPSSVSAASSLVTHTTSPASPSALVQESSYPSANANRLPYETRPSPNPHITTTDSFPPEELSDEGDDKKHICTLCRKRFNRPSSLRIHMNTHTGATPFCCPYPGCGRKFNVNSNMRRHYRNHNTTAATRPTQQTSTATSISPISPPHSPPANLGVHAVKREQQQHSQRSDPNSFLILRPDIPLHPAAASTSVLIHSPRHYTHHYDPNSESRSPSPDPESDDDSFMDIESHHLLSPSTLGGGGTGGGSSSPNHRDIHQRRELRRHSSPYKLQPVGADFYEHQLHHPQNNHRRAQSPSSSVVYPSSLPYSPVTAAPLISPYSDIRSHPSPNFDATAAAHPFSSTSSSSSLSTKLSLRVSTTSLLSPVPMLSPLPTSSISTSTSATFSSPTSDDDGSRESSPMPIWKR
ncbi:hypothetical protein K435DRAFT_761759 [Dendrothele bispora CBS 962.96]|uniref:C2H2-type domain-containing protein n=1 Tax=Dendrothele bispora (strain CBS 962.96) TaxID=1314807 RepID=A0A4S8LHY3_DENBC|nr:hypothetical protein K435DRAFT_761759 [Dendrothele bispora CBS 962.96]